MTTTIDDLRLEAAARKRSILTQIGASQPINPPTWEYFAAEGESWKISLVEPKQDDGNSYITQGLGAFPTDLQNSAAIPALFFYQAQLATDTSFTQAVTTYDLGNSRNISVHTDDLLTKYARARARLANSNWSDWRPFTDADGTSTLATTAGAVKFVPQPNSRRWFLQISNPTSETEGAASSVQVLGTIGSSSASGGGIDNHPASATAPHHCRAFSGTAGSNQSTQFATARHLYVGRTGGYVSLQSATRLEANTQSISSLCVVGLTDQTSAGTFFGGALSSAVLIGNFIGFVQNGTNWEARCQTSSGATSGVTVAVADTSWHHLEFQVDENTATRQVRFYYDDELAATIDTTVPDDLLMKWIWAVKQNVSGAGLDQRAISVAWIYGEEIIPVPLAP